MNESLAQPMEQTADADQVSVSLTPQRVVKERFKNKEYMNWQRACQSLVMLKEFIEPFMDKKAKQLHEYILARVGVRAIVVCQRDHNIQKNDANWWMPRGPVTSKTTQTQTQAEQVDELANVLQELQEDEATASSSPESPVPGTTSVEAAVGHNTPATGQKR